MTEDFSCCNPNITGVIITYFDGAGAINCVYELVLEVIVPVSVIIAYETCFLVVVSQFFLSVFVELVVQQQKRLFIVD